MPELNPRWRERDQTDCSLVSPQSPQWGRAAKRLTAFNGDNRDATPDATFWWRYILPEGFQLSYNHTLHRTWPDSHWPSVSLCSAHILQQCHLLYIPPRDPVYICKFFVVIADPGNNHGIDRGKCVFVRSRVCICCRVCTVHASFM